MQPATFPSGKRQETTRPPDSRPPTTAMRAHTSFTERISTHKLLRVRNEESWPAGDFREYLDALMAAAGIPNDAALARAAEIDASLLSNWRSGKQQPSRRSLKKIAGPLRTRPASLYLMAGLDEREDLELGDTVDLTVWAREFHQLREVYEEYVAAGRGQEVLNQVGTLTAGLSAQLAGSRDQPSRRRRTA
jgi:transcriptional regulator with XRE-family HTH domain